MSKFHIDLEQLSQKCFGNDELVQKLIVRFQASVPQLIEKMVQAANNNEMVELRKIAHHLKGEAGTMCADEIASLAGRIIETAQTQQRKELALLIAELSGSVTTTPLPEATVISVEFH